MPALVDAYDAALFDLDGVVYLGPVAVDGAPDGIRALRERGIEVVGGCIHEDGSRFENLSDPEETFHQHFRVESETTTEKYEHDGESYTSEHTWNRIEPLIHS